MTLQCQVVSQSLHASKKGMIVKPAGKMICVTDYMLTTDYDTPIVNIAVKTAMAGIGSADRGGYR